jgi:hypothetical protein
MVSLNRFSNPTKLVFFFFFKNIVTITESRSVLNKLGLKRAALKVIDRAKDGQYVSTAIRLTPAKARPVSLCL